MDWIFDKLIRYLRHNLNCYVIHTVWEKRRSGAALIYEKQRKDEKMKLTFKEQLIYSTVRIEVLDKNKKNKNGTGFFFDFCQDSMGDDISIPGIITNRNLLAGAESIKFYFIIKNEHGEPEDRINFNIDITYITEKYVYNHPDPHVDLCFMFLREILMITNIKPGYIFYFPFNIDFIASHADVNEMDAVENVMMVSYPNGIWDKTNNKPIFFMGNTATHPKFNYNGNQEILVNIACYPGSGGSPVILVNEGLFQNREGQVCRGNRKYLLGVLFATPQLNGLGEIQLNEISSSEKMIPIDYFSMQMGAIVKADRILDLNKIVFDIICADQMKAYFLSEC